MADELQQTHPSSPGEATRPNTVQGVQGRHRGGNSPDRATTAVGFQELPTRPPLRALWDETTGGFALGVPSFTLVQELLKTLTEHAERYVGALRTVGSRDISTTGGGLVSRAQFLRRIMRALQLADPRLLMSAPTGLLQSAIGQVFDTWDVDAAGELPILELSRIMLRHGSLRKPRKLRHGAISQSDLRLPLVEDVTR